MSTLLFVSTRQRSACLRERIRAPPRGLRRDVKVMRRCLRRTFRFQQGVTERSFARLVAGRAQLTPTPRARKSTIGLHTFSKQNGDGQAALQIYPPTDGRDVPPFGSLRFDKRPAQRKHGGQRKRWDHEIVKFLEVSDKIGYDKILPDDTSCERWLALARDTSTWQS